MKNIFIINGHEKYGTKEGRLNKTLVDYMVTLLGENHYVKTTTIQDGYNIKEEQDKFYGPMLLFIKHRFIGLVFQAYLKRIWMKYMNMVCSLKVQMNMEQVVY